MHGTIKNIIGDNGLIEYCKNLERYKNDLVMDTQDIKMISDTEMEIPRDKDRNNIGIFKMSDHASSQISQRLNIPKKYFDGLPNRIPGLRQTIVNEHLNKEPEKRLLRLEEKPDQFSLRAFLSDRYRRFDNLHALEAMLPSLHEMHNNGVKFTIKSANVSDRRMYLQIMFDHLETEVEVGDPVCYGVTVTNSEVGAGAWNISEMVWRLVCSNGMISGSLNRRHHIGSRLDVGESGISEYVTDETVEADLKAQQLTIRDIFKGAISTTSNLENLIKPLKEAAGIKIEKPKATIEKLSQRFSFSEETTDKFMENFFTEGNMTKWGVINGITALSHNSKDADEQYGFEQSGWEVANMTDTDWSTIVN